MTNGQRLQRSKNLSPEDQLAFNRWLTGNAVIGSMIAAGLTIMAVAGSTSVPPSQVQLAGIERAVSHR
jgi:hypothetical protein